MNGTCVLNAKKTAIRTGNFTPGMFGDNSELISVGSFAVLLDPDIGDMDSETQARFKKVSTT